MRGKLSSFIFIVLLLFLHACGKENVPQKESQEEPLALTFKLKMHKKLGEPTIINGYYGRLLVSGEPKKQLDSTAIRGLPSRNPIYVYEASSLPGLEKVAFQKKGKTFYDLKKAEEKENVVPRYIIKPNKSGFYQIDTDNKMYYLLIETDRNTGYYPTGPLKIGSTEKRLVALDLILSDIN